MRRFAVPAVLIPCVALAATLLVAPPTAAGVPAQATVSTSALPHSSEPTAPGGTPRIAVATLASLAYAAVGAIIDCEKLSEQIRGCPEEKTISFVSQKLREIEGQMARNQARTERALDVLQQTVDGQALAAAVLRLNPIEAHIFEAVKAWDAMSACTQKARTAGAKCQGYNGKSTGDVPVYDGIRVSRVHFLSQMNEIDISIAQATHYFAGTSSIRGTDGFLHALWTSAKRQQDRLSGVGVALPSLIPPVVTRSLAVDFLPTMTYYRDMVYLYGAMKPAMKALKGKNDEAQSEANLADARIFADTSRWTVTGAAEFYRIPDVPVGAIAYVGKDGNLYKIVQGEGKGTRLTAGVVQELGGRLAAGSYNADDMRRDPALLPHDGRFGVIEKVLRRNHIEYLGKYAICASEASIRPCDPGLDGTAAVTFELGHSGPIGWRDEYGNLMKERWVPIRVLKEPARWDTLVAQARAERFGSCKLRGEPPAGVFKVRYLDTWLALGLEGKHAGFEWSTVRYGYSNSLNVTPRCVGPGVYVSQTRGEPFSVVNRGKPAGILVAK
jgi:hypothetical protein